MNAECFYMQHVRNPYKKTTLICTDKNSFLPIVLGYISKGQMFTFGISPYLFFFTNTLGQAHKIARVMFSPQSVIHHLPPWEGAALKRRAKQLFCVGGVFVSNVC